MRKPRELKVTCYTARMVDINENLSALPGAKEGEKIFDMEINEILLNIISNGQIKQLYVQCFDFETITFKQYVNIFEHMQIAETIYDGVVELSYTKTTRYYDNCVFHSR